MERLHINVTAEAVRALHGMSVELCDHNNRLMKTLSDLRNAFDDNAMGLGPHTAELNSLLEELEKLAAEAVRNNRRLAKKAERAAVVRQSLMDSNPYRPEEMTRDDQYIPQVLGRIYDDLVRQRIRPKELGPDKEVRGSWKDEVFYASDDFVPKKFNPEGKNFGQIRQELSQKYGINFNGISYESGYADFREVAVAQVGIEEIVAAHGEKEPLGDLEKIFAGRKENFDFADGIAAKEQLPIPGLAPGYTAEDLARWRKSNRFSWDESYINGYILVPSVIHGNISHTGLVSVGTRGTEAEKTFAQRHGGG